MSSLLLSRILGHQSPQRFQALVRRRSRSISCLKSGKADHYDVGNKSSLGFYKTVQIYNGPGGEIMIPCKDTSKSQSGIYVNPKTSKSFSLPSPRVEPR
jgi:hypothetical protein